jgi:hypothetical protein
MMCWRIVAGEIQSRQGLSLHSKNLLQMQKALSVVKRVAMIFGYDGLEKLTDIWVMRLRNFNKELWLLAC